MAERTAKNALFDGFAQVAKALGNGRRAELIDVLAQGERRVEDLAAEIEQSVANTSFHLRTLAEAGLVSTRRDGTRIYYRLASVEVAELWAGVRDVATTHHTQLDELTAAYLGDRSDIQTISRAELARRLAAGDVVLIDVRHRDEFDSGHIDGARSVPLETLNDDLGALPEDLEVVAYCRGPHCAYADEAVRYLQASGRIARRLEEGYPEWHRQGVAHSDPPALSR